MIVGAVNASTGDMNTGNRVMIALAAIHRHILLFMLCNCLRMLFSSYRVQAMTSLMSCGKMKRLTFLHVFLICNLNLPHYFDLMPVNSLNPDSKKLCTSPVEDECDYSDGGMSDRVRIRHRRAYEPPTYNNSRLGTVDLDHPIVNATGQYPLDDLEIGTMFILQLISRCPSRRRHEPCIREMYIHYENVSNWAKFIPRCEVLTVTIAGYIGGNLDQIKKHLSIYHIQRHRLSCNLDVDWEKAAGWLVYPYLTAAANVITVGRQLALLLLEMINLTKVRAEDIHLIGHSLGAQVTHQTSLWLRNLTSSTSRVDGLRVGRITGLDPLAVRFQGWPGTHLVKDDADFVDVIHTSSNPDPKPDLVVNVFASELLGMSEMIGSIDFFPNGGTSYQPGCRITSVASYCSHRAARAYFLQSLFSSSRTRDADEMVFPSNRCRLNVTEDNLNGTAIYSCSSMGMQAIKFAGVGRHCLNTTLGWKKFLVKRACEKGERLVFLQNDPNTTSN